MRRNTISLRGPVALDLLADETIPPLHAFECSKISRPDVERKLSRVYRTAHATISRRTVASVGTSLRGYGRRPVTRRGRTLLAERGW